MQELVDWVVAAGSSPWMFLILFFFVAIDAFFPPVPSESAVVAVAAISASEGWLHVGLLFLVAAAGAWVGDNVAYAIGRGIGTHGLRRIKWPKLHEGLDWAGRQLDRRAATLLLAARYVPVGRTAVNLTAGASGFPRRHFMLLTILSSLSWALWSVGLGLAAGQWLETHPLVVAGISVVLGFFFGLAIDQVLRRFTHLYDLVDEVAEEDEEPAEADRDASQSACSG